MMFRAARLTMLTRSRTSAAALIGVAAHLCGCASTQPATFPAKGAPIYWPPPPDTPRIRYIGELTGEASIGRHITAGESFRAIFEGPRESVRFATPTAVAITGSKVYVADPSHGTGPLIHVLDINTQTYSQIRDAGGTPLRWPIDMAATATALAIADAQLGVVFLLDNAGRGVRTIGKGQLKRPAAVAWLDDHSDELCVLDAGAHALLTFDSHGEIRSVFGQRGASDGQFNFPAGIACFPAAIEKARAAPRLAVADSMNFRVQLFAKDYGIARVFGLKGDAAGNFSLPRDVAVDSAGHIYVLDNQFENIQVFDADGSLLLAFGEEGGGPGQFNLPSGITIDAQDRIWVADTYNRRVQAFQYLAENQQ